MSYIVVDVEADGQAAGVHSMVCFGAVVVRDGLADSFYSGLLKPISPQWEADALAVSGFSREDMEKGGREPIEVMLNFENWVKGVSKGKPIFISDNNGFDWQYINYYFWKYVGRNPFGWTSRRIGDLWCGMQNDVRCGWQHLRDTKPTHNPVDDARGNAEALLKMRDMGLKIKLV